jgi:hypothetical protein
MGKGLWIARKRTSNVKHVGLGESSTACNGRNWQRPNLLLKQIETEEDWSQVTCKVCLKSYGRA